MFLTLRITLPFASLSLQQDKENYRDVIVPKPFKFNYNRDIIVHSIALIDKNFTPVSYTHLDVYKRQQR